MAAALRLLSTAYRVPFITIRHSVTERMDGLRRVIWRHMRNSELMLFLIGIAAVTGVSVIAYLGMH